MDCLRQACFVLMIAQLSGCVSLSQDDPAQPDLEAYRIELLRLNEELARSQIIRRDPVFFSEVAVEQFRVLARED